MCINGDRAVEKAFKNLVKNYNRQIASAEKNDDYEEIRRIQKNFSGAFEYYGTLIIESNPEVKEQTIQYGENVYLSDNVRHYLNKHKKSFISRGIIETSGIKRMCFCCGNKIIGLGLTDFSNSCLSICFECCNKDNYFNDEVKLINYV